MKPERWQAIKERLDHAIALDPSSRSSYLDTACGTDTELRSEVESLLASHQQAGTGFLQQSMTNMWSQAAAATAPARDRHIGPYHLLEEIGHGGMGEVYRAIRDDGQYQKEVAIKFVRGFATHFVVEHFRTERQILASLVHPDIARLLDGGTTEDGVPYLVMDLIEGVSIDRYCIDRGITITERLRLFRQVCDAVQYAHQRMVIHRDIKPSNILVTREGVPKLLDFGIAKLLDPSAIQGATLAQPMTPEYASPEQIRGELVTATTDVYSLGVVLYQLLTGLSPYRGDTTTPHGMARAVCEEDPIPPSSAVVGDGSSENENGASTATLVESLRQGSASKLRRQLKGDLDNIVLKALRKAPSQRYPSVEKFSEDIRRYMEALPVTARKSSWSYRAGKFAKRHKLGLASAGLIIAAVLVGAAATIREAHIAAANAQRAEKRFNDVRKLANSLIFEIHDSIRDLPGSLQARQLLVNRALEYLDDLSRQSADDKSLQKELASAYARVGDVLGYTYGPNLGDRPGALKSYQKAVALWEKLAEASPDDVDLQRELSDYYTRITNVEESAGDFRNALTSIERSYAIMQRVTTKNKDPQLLDRLAGALYFRAELRRRMSDSTGALADYQQAIAILEAAGVRTHLAADYGGMAMLLNEKGEPAQAVAWETKAVELLKGFSQQSPNNAVVREYLGEALGMLSEFQMANQELAAGLTSAKEEQSIFHDLVGADPRNSLARANLGFSELHIAGAYLDLGRLPLAVQVFHEATSNFEAMSPKTASDRYIRTGLAMSYCGLAQAHAALALASSTSPRIRRKEWIEAHDWYQRSSATWSDKRQRGEVETSELVDEKKATEGLQQSQTALLKR